MRNDKERRIRGRWDDEPACFQKMRRLAHPRVDPIVKPRIRSNRVIGRWQLRREEHPRLLRLARESLFGFLRKRGLDGHTCKKALQSTSFLRVIRLTHTGCIFGWDDPHVHGQQVWFHLRERDYLTKMVDGWQVMLNDRRTRRRRRLKPHPECKAA